jgi:hypothetical protein
LFLIAEKVREPNTMNLSEDLSVDKELFSGVYEGKYLSLIYIKNNILLYINEFSL